MNIPPGMVEDEEFLSRRTLTQLLGVVVASSMFVLALYIVGIIGNARDDGDSAPSSSVLVAQMPPTVPPADPASPATESSTRSSSTTTSGDGAATTTTIGTSPGTDGTAAGTTVSSTRPPAEIPSIVGVSASEVRDGSTDSCGAPTSYEPDLAFDDVRETAWMMPGDGVGAALTIQLAEPSVVSEVGLVPGYDKVDPCTGTDRFEEMRRVTAVRWTFDDGTSIVQNLDPTRVEQTTSMDLPVVSSRITMTIVSTTEPGVERLDHTPVSEVVVS